MSLQSTLCRLIVGVSQMPQSDMATHANPATLLEKEPTGIPPRCACLGPIGRCHHPTRKGYIDRLGKPWRPGISTTVLRSTVADPRPQLPSYSTESALRAGATPQTCTRQPSPSASVEVPCAPAEILSPQLTGIAGHGCSTSALSVAGSYFLGEYPYPPSKTQIDVAWSSNSAGDVCKRPNTRDSVRRWTVRELHHISKGSP